MLRIVHDCIFRGKIVIMINVLPSTSLYLQIQQPLLDTSSVVLSAAPSSVPTGLFKRSLSYYPEPVMPRKYITHFEQKTLDDIALKFDVSANKSPLNNSLTDFFNISIASLNKLEFGLPRIMGFLELFDTKVDNVISKTLVHDNKLYEFAVYQTNFLDYCVEADAEVLESDKTENGGILVLELERKCASDDENNTVFRMAVYLDTFHGEWVIVGGNRIQGTMVKNLLCQLSNLFITQALLKDEAKLYLPLEDSKYQFIDYGILYLSSWLLLARNDPHTFYGSHGFEPYSLKDRATAIETHQNNTVYAISHDKDFYSSAVTYVRNIPVSTFSDCLGDPRDKEEFERLVKKYRGKNNTFTSLAQKIDSARCSSDMVSLSVMINLLRPFKKNGDEGYVWLALNIIKANYLFIAKPPFGPASTPLSDKPFKLLTSQQLENSGMQTLKAFTAEFFYNAEDSIEIASPPSCVTS